MELTDQTILISGAAGSVGREVISSLCQKGIQVVGVDMNNEGVDALANDFPVFGAYQCDLTDPDQTESIVGEIWEKHRPTVLLNNAGIIHSEPLVNLLSKEDPKHAFDTWDKTIRSNLYSTFNLTRSIASRMVQSRVKGCIISVSSVSAVGNVGQTAYSAAKAGIEAMTVTWTKELGMFGIRVNAISPGFFDTVSTRMALSDAVIQKKKAAVPLRKLGDTQELVKAVEFIISADYFNGQVLEINGGLRI